MLCFVMLGCQNTPKKGSRYCIDEYSFLIDGEVAHIDWKKEMLPVRVLNEKETRQGKFYEVCIPVQCSQYMGLRTLYVNKGRSIPTCNIG